MLILMKDRPPLICRSYLSDCQNQHGANDLCSCKWHLFWCVLQMGCPAGKKGGFHISFALTLESSGWGEKRHILAQCSLINVLVLLTAFLWRLWRKCRVLFWTGRADCLSVLVFFSQHFRIDWGCDILTCYIMLCNMCWPGCILSPWCLSCITLIHSTPWPHKARCCYHNSCQGQCLQPTMWALGLA